MVHVIFDPTKVLTFTQVGGGLSPGPYYRGFPYQQGFGIVQNGRGLGNVLSSFWRFLSPVLKNVGMDIGCEAFAAGGRILDDLETKRRWLTLSKLTQVEVLVVFFTALQSVTSPLGRQEMGCVGASKNLQTSRKKPCSRRCPVEGLMC